MGMPNVAYKELPEECNLTLEHANVHMESALRCEEVGDIEQIIHELRTIIHILVVKIDKLEKEG